MLTEGNILEVIVRQRYAPLAKDIFNVYHYRAFDVVGSWTLVEDFNQIASEVLIGQQNNFGDLQSNGLVYDNAIFRNLTNGIDLGEYTPATALTGMIAAPAEPLQVALSFKLVRSTQVTRNGSKRLGAVGDTVVVDPGGNGLAGSTEINAIQSWLSTPIDVVAGDGVFVTLVPIILRKPAPGVVPTIYSDVSSAIYRGTGSQNSRKVLL